MRRRNPRSGVALLEMMIALMVMTMTALLIASALGFQGRSMTVVAQRSARVEEALSRDLLRRWVEAIPLSAQYIGADPERRFVGTARSLRFTTFLPNGPFWAGDPVHVAVEGTDDGRAVALGQGTHLTTREPLTREEVFGRDAPGLRFSYYGALVLHGRPGWHEAWDGSERLPMLVRIEAATASFIPLVLEPGLIERQSFISRSSLLPPARPSRP